MSNWYRFFCVSVSVFVFSSTILTASDECAEGAGPNEPVKYHSQSEVETLLRGVTFVEETETKQSLKQLLDSRLPDHVELRNKAEAMSHSLSRMLDRLEEFKTGLGLWVSGDMNVLKVLFPIAKFVFDEKKIPISIVGKDWDRLEGHNILGPVENAGEMIGQHYLGNNKNSFAPDLLGIGNVLIVFSAHPPSEALTENSQFKHIFKTTHFEHLIDTQDDVTGWYEDPVNKPLWDLPKKAKNKNGKVVTLDLKAEGYGFEIFSVQPTVLHAIQSVFNKESGRAVDITFSSRDSYWLQMSTLKGKKCDIDDFIRCIRFYRQYVFENFPRPYAREDFSKIVTYLTVPKSFPQERYKVINAARVMMATPVKDCSIGLWVYVPEHLGKNDFEKALLFEFHCKFSFMKAHGYLSNPDDEYYERFEIGKNFLTRTSQYLQPTEILDFMQYYQGYRVIIFSQDKADETLRENPVFKQAFKYVELTNPLKREEKPIEGPSWYDVIDEEVSLEKETESASAEPSQDEQQESLGLEDSHLDTSESDQDSPPRPSVVEEEQVEPLADLAPPLPTSVPPSCQEDLKELRRLEAILIDLFGPLDDPKQIINEFTAKHLKGLLEKKTEKIEELLHTAVASELKDLINHLKVYNKYSLILDQRLLQGSQAEGGLSPSAPLLYPELEPLNDQPWHRPPPMNPAYNSSESDEIVKSGSLVIPMVISTKKLRLKQNARSQFRKKGLLSAGSRDLKSMADNSLNIPSVPKQKVAKTKRKKAMLLAN